MPTSCRQFGELEQAAEKVRACTHPVTVWACEAPCGWFNLLREDGKYRLTGAGLRLFGQVDPFSPDISIIGVDDADAVGSAKRLILARWRHELGQMEAAFEIGRPPDDRGPGLFDQSGDGDRGPMEQPYQEWANGGGPNECSHGIAAGLHCTPCGGISGRTFDPDGTADLDDPGGGPVG